MIYCEIIDRGELYSTHTNKAIELGADVDMNNPDNKESKHRWVFNQGINNDLCVLLCKIDYFCLVERIEDNKQFVMNDIGIKITTPVLDNKLFEI